MIIDIILCLIIGILLWRIFKSKEYTKINFYDDMISFCTWSMEKLERIKNHFYLKKTKEKNDKQETNNNI